MNVATVTALVGISFALACSGSEGGGQGGAGAAAPDGSSNVDASSGVGGANADSGHEDNGGGGSGNGGGGNSGSGGNAGAGGNSGSGGGDASGIDARSAGDGAISDSQSSPDAAGSSRACVGATCAATEVCVAYRSIGGAVLRPDDAGSCPPGKHREGTPPGGLCFDNFVYRCVPLMGCASMPISCSCAARLGAETANTCPNGYPTCQDPTPATWLDPAAQLICQLLVP